ncbi:MAG: hypothetical protein JRJ70_14625 [Deltaproteobacteria bacterium]|nr:hypothetical protein [Deltaproteobacteria bacterium]
MKKPKNSFLKNLRYLCLVGVIALGLMTIVGSGGGGGGGDAATTTPPPTDDGGDTTPITDGGDTTAETHTTFNISNAVSLLAMEQTVTAASVRKTSSDGRPLFTYEIWNEGLEKPLTKEEIAERAKQRSAKQDGEEEAGTNLLACDEEGNCWLAIDSYYPIKVMYSVTDPAGEYVYLALDTGWWGDWDGNDYTQFIAQENCAFFRVKIADNTIECVKEGTFVQNMDDMYMQTVCGDQKPIQFDDDSNVYFTGTTFEREEWEDCWWDEGAQTNICTTHYMINQTTWNPLLYRLDNETGEIDDLTPDNTSVQFFVVLPTGEIAYQSWNIDTWSAGGLYMWQDGQTIPLSGETWGVNFFTGDTSNAVMWGSWDEYGVRFARPRTQGGAERATLNTKLFGGAFSDQYSSTPRRIIVGDDGRLYGVFESWLSEYDSTQEMWIYDTVLSVFQILPYDGIPKVELSLGDDPNAWWNWMQDTPFKVSKGFLYYTEQETVEFYGERDVIKMVKLEDRASNTLLDSNDPIQRYEIYSWSLSGDTLYFSGLDLTTTTVVTGEIDTLKVRQGQPESDYLTVTETASAIGATSAVQDIEVLRPRQPETDTGSAPTVEKFYVTTENIYSASIDFTKYMNKSSVEDNLSFSDGTNDVDSMKIWIYKSLHLIPDLGGLGDNSTSPLVADTQYTITLGSGTQDAYGWDLAAGTQGKSVTWKTRPDSGWYYATTDAADTAISETGVAKYAGPVEEYTKETFQLWANADHDTEVDATGNVRIEFSAVNYGWDGVDVVLWNNTNYDAGMHAGDTWMGFDAIVRMGNWTSIDYKTGEYDDWSSDWADGNTPNLFNGNWARYRVDFYGTNLVVSYSEDGIDFDPVMSVYDFKNRVGNTDNLTFLIRASNPVVVDNLQVTTLTQEGEVATAAGDILDLDFTGSIDSQFGTTDVSANYGLDGWW